MTLSFPPFTRAVKIIIIINVAVHISLLIANRISPGAMGSVQDAFGLRPTDVVHGLIWQVATYAFLHADGWHLFGNMIGLWMFGSRLESGWGTRQFLEFYSLSVLCAAFTTIAISFTRLLGASPDVGTIGASGGVYGILMAFALLYGNEEFMLFPFPVSIKAKYLVGAYMLILVISILEPGPKGIAYFAHLGGALFGLAYVKLFPRRGLQYAASEQYYGARNWYQKWKRRRAAKKFEVYMRKHDRAEFFDEYGNYKPPDKKDGEGGRGPWVN
jgi:membrane associated rhomboid family serine protease